MSAGALPLAALLAVLGAPPGQASSAAGAATDPSTRLDPIEATALAAVRASLPQRTVPALSEPLVRAARSLAARAARGDPRPLSSSALRAALAEAGVLDPAPAAVLLAARSASLPEALAAAARFRGATHLGIGVVSRDGVAWAVLLASERRAELGPFPRQVNPGEQVTLRGHLLGLSSPRVYVSTPSGAARELPVWVEAGRFVADVRFDEPGTWRLEVGGDGPRGPTVAAVLEVRCGREQALSAPPDEPDPPEPEAWIAAAIDALRAGQGLPPIRRSAPLDEQARRHAMAMLAAGTVAHRVDGGGDVASRVAAAAIEYRSARENVARGSGALDAHRAIVESPSHLANLLAPGVSLLGVGIARGTLPGGQPVTYLTEILVEPRE
jgi:hypothetical protein